MSLLAQHLMMLLGAQGHSENAWDPAHKSSLSVLSNSNLTNSGLGPAPGYYGSVRALLPVTGLCYLSCAPSTSVGGATAGFGLADEAADFTSNSTWVGDSNLSVGCWAQNGNVYFNGVSLGSAGPGSTVGIQIAVRPSRRVWVRRVGGAFVGGGDPEADTSPTCTLGGSGLIYPAASCSATTLSEFITIHKDAAQVTGTPPTGFTPALWL